MSVKKQSKISALKIRRIIFHICLGLTIMLLALYNVSFARKILLTAIIIGIFISLLSLRLKIPFIYFMLKKFESPRYIRKFPGKSALFFIAGCLLALKLFPNNMALASIGILTFGDPFSHVLSYLSNKRYTKPRNVFKNIYGTIAGVFVSFAASSYFVYWLYALLASVIAMIAESFIITLGDEAIDDNFFIPLIAGTVIYILTRINF